MSPLADAAVALGVHDTAVFPPDLPVFAGHFPGNPVVPGVHQLALIVASVQQRSGSPWSLHAIVHAKWPAVARPGEMLAVSATWTRDGDLLHVRGRVMRGEVLTCACRLLLRERWERT